MRSIEWRYFQWPWVTPNYQKLPHFPHVVSPIISSNLIDRLTVSSPRPWMIKPSLKRAWSNHFKFLDAPIMSLERLKLELRFFYASRACQVLACGWQITPKEAWSGSHDDFSILTAANIGLSMKFRVRVE